MELYLERERLQRHYIKGYFLKGAIPHNKGKKWDEWLPKKYQKATLKRLSKYRTGRKDIGGEAAKECIGIKDGKVYAFAHSVEAEKITGVCSRNIRHCYNGERPTAGGFKWFLKESEEWLKLMASAQRKIAPQVMGVEDVELSAVVGAKKRQKLLITNTL